MQSRILDNGDETMNYEGDVGSGKLSRTSGMAENSILGSTETVYVGSSKTARKQLEKVQKTIADRSEKNILRYLPTINETCANLHLPGTVKVSRNAKLISMLWLIDRLGKSFFFPNLICAFPTTKDCSCYFPRTRAMNRCLTCLVKTERENYAKTA
jgi:hypothetical protein